MDLGLLEFFQHLVGRIVFRHIHGIAHDGKNGGRWVGSKQVFDTDNPFDMVDIIFTNRIHGMDHFLHRGFYFTDRFFTIDPGDLAAVCHQGCDITVTEMKYPLNDILFRFFNGTMFCSFADNGFDLFFGYLVIVAFDIE